MIQAPPPSGGDDTAALQPLLLQAQASGGGMELQPGTYRANLETAQDWTQPLLVGAGLNRTTLKAFTAGKPALRLKGGSGLFSGGFLADFTIQSAEGGGGVGLELADCGGVRWTRLGFNGPLAEGLRFHNESPGGFTEFDHGDAVFAVDIRTPVRYLRTGGDESFHGSGLTTGSVIQQGHDGTTGPLVVIEAGAFPYNAPMSVAVFPVNAGTTVIDNRHATRRASFHGTVTIETQLDGHDVTVGHGGRIYHAGQVMGFAGPNLRLGTLYLVDETYYLGGAQMARYRPFRRLTTLAPAATKVVPDGVGTCSVQIDLVAPYYHFTYWLDCWQSPYDSSGVVTVRSNPKALNQAGLGAPVFSWNDGLVVTNPSYSAAVKAYVTVTPSNNPVSDDVFGQF